MLLLIDNNFFDSFDTKSPSPGDSFLGLPILLSEHDR